MSKLSQMRQMIPTAQVSSLTTGSITLPGARGARVPEYDDYSDGMDLIATYTTTSNYSSVTFSSIPSTYHSLWIRITGGTASGGDSSFLMYYNSTSSATGMLNTRVNYPSGSGTLYTQWITDFGGLDDGTAGDGTQQCWNFFITNYASSTGRKTHGVFTGVVRDGGTSRLPNYSTGTFTTNSNAISTLYFKHNNGANYIRANTRFSLYGMK